MLSPAETDRVMLKAIEQALRIAGLAQADPLPLLPEPNTWPFRLSKDDIAFLRSCPYPISPA